MSLWLTVPVAPPEIWTPFCAIVEVGPAPVIVLFVIIPLEPAPLTVMPFFWKSSIVFDFAVTEPAVDSCERPAWIATPFWQPPNGLSRMCVMWLFVTTAEPPPSMRTPYSRLSQLPLPGPWIVKSLNLTFVEPVTRTIALLADIVAGAWIVAARWPMD